MTIDIEYMKSAIQCNAVCYSDGHNYPRLFCPEHPLSEHGYRKIHIVIAEVALGRLLPEGAEVHHVDDDKSNFTNTNLVICEDRAYHFLLHARSRIVRRGGDPDTQLTCASCDRVLDRGLFNKSRTHWSGRATCRCRECNSTYMNEYRRRTA